MYSTSASIGNESSSESAGPHTNTDSRVVLYSSASLRSRFRTSQCVSQRESNVCRDVSEVNPEFESKNAPRQDTTIPVK
jgi:hypothetical protein